MKTDGREVVAAALPALALAVAFGAAAALLMATMEPAERSAFEALVAPRVALLLMLWSLLSLAGGVALRRAWLSFGVAPGRLAEQVQVLLQTGAEVALSAGGSAGSRALATAVAELVQQRALLRADVARQVTVASQAVEQERSRLATLMAELTQSVVVCNLDGRILLFNGRAQTLFGALLDGPAIGGASAIALGRSIHGVIDRALVAHALATVQQRAERGDPRPSAQFVTGTRNGALLRVQLAPVRAAGEAALTVSDAPGLPSPQTPPISGFVLLLDNITREVADAAARERLLQQTTETSRASLGTLQAAVELLDDPALDTGTRARFQAVVRDEVGAMGRRLAELAMHTTQAPKTPWPLEDILGSDLVAAARQRIEQAHGCRTAATDVDGTLWLKVDSYALIQLLVGLAGRLVEEYEVGVLRLRLQPAAGRAQLDLVWAGRSLSTETAVAWETEPLPMAGDSPALTVRDVIERHDGAFWFERERVRHEAFFRMLLPLADSAGAAAVPPPVPQRNDSRPEFYDFDLFQADAQAGGWAERQLAQLRCTVFDTETTGLNPSDGDRILQIGAVRIDAGKLRRHDVFDQLVDPQRDIPAAGLAIHGITPAMVAGQPTMAVVLPAFHAFAADTVLVAHNAAFDMRFLQLQEAATGMVFGQPVLDTLLLSTVVHPQQQSHRLEAIAERLGVPLLGRHTALGDAMVTAEVYLKLVPLLEAMGIQTLGQALEAAQATYLARVTY